MPLDAMMSTLRSMAERACAAAAAGVKMEELFRLLLNTVQRSLTDTSTHDTLLVLFKKKSHLV